MVLLALLPAVCVRGSGRVCHGLRRTRLDADRSQRGPGLHEGEDPHQYVSSPHQITVDNDPALTTHARVDAGLLVFDSGKRPEALVT